MIELSTLLAGLLGFFLFLLAMLMIILRINTLGQKIEHMSRLVEGTRKQE